MSRRAFIFLITFLGTAPLSWAQNAGHHIRTGNELLEQGKFGQALRAFDKAIELQPTAQGYSSRAQVHFITERMDPFILDVEQALKLDSTHARANYQRALYAMRTREWKRAEKHCTTALENTSNELLQGRILIVRGEARGELANYEAAIEDLERGLYLGDEDLEAEAFLAAQYAKTGRHSEAVKALRKLTQKMPDVTENWVNLGFELAADSLHEQALKAYDKALEIDKDEPITLSNKAYSLLQLGRKEEAMKLVNKSLRARGNNPYALRTRALLYLKKGDRKKACDDLFAARLTGDLEEVNRLILENCSGMGRRGR